MTDKNRSRNRLLIHTIFYPVDFLAGALSECRNLFPLPVIILLLVGTSACLSESAAMKNMNLSGSTQQSAMSISSGGKTEAADALQTASADQKISSYALAVSELCPPEKDLLFLSDNMFLMRWGIIGPFVSIPQEGYDLVPLSGIQENVMFPGENLFPGKQWIYPDFSANSQGNGQIRMALPSGEMVRQETVIYASAVILSAQEENAVKLYTSGNGPMKVWLNGRLIFKLRVPESEQRPIDQVAAEQLFLRKGINQIVVKYVKPEGSSWMIDFYLRLSDNRNNPFPLRIPQNTLPNQKTVLH